jgi:hypothetical protein
VTYPLTVTNIGVQGKGMIAEGLTVSLTLPAGNNVVAATGQGYQGVANNVASWKLARSASKDQEKLTVTLSQALAQGANVPRHRDLGKARAQDWHRRTGRTRRGPRRSRKPGEAHIR